MLRGKKKCQMFKIKSQNKRNTNKTLQSKKKNK